MNFRYQKVTKPSSEFSKYNIGDLVKFGTGVPLKDTDYYGEYIGAIGLVQDIWWIETCGYNKQDKPKISCRYVVRWTSGKVSNIEEEKLIRL